MCLACIFMDKHAWSYLPSYMRRSTQNILGWVDGYMDRGTQPHPHAHPDLGLQQAYIACPVHTKN